MAMKRTMRWLAGAALWGLAGFAGTASADVDVNIGLGVPIGGYYYDDYYATPRYEVHEYYAPRPVYHYYDYGPRYRYYRHEHYRDYYRHDHRRDWDRQSNQHAQSLFDCLMESAPVCPGGEFGKRWQHGAPDAPPAAGATPAPGAAPAPGATPAL